MNTQDARTIADPVPSPETEAYWSAANDGRLLLRRCTACYELHFYPRTMCPHCYGETTWEAASGLGTIYSFSVARRAEVPYAIAFVALDEGVTMMTNIVGCDLDTIRIGQKVRVVFERSESGQAVPMFTPLVAD